MRRVRLMSGVMGLAGLLVCAGAQAAVLAQYTFSPAVNPPTYSSVDANVIASTVTGGTGTSVGPSNNFYTTAPFVIVSRTNDTAAQNYFQVSITAAAGYALDLSSFSIDLGAGGTTGPRTASIKDSVDGLLTTSTSLADLTLTSNRGASGPTGVLPTYSYDLSAAKYQDLSSFTVRVYISTPGVSQNIDVDNLVFNGAAVALPEPGVAGLGIVAGAGLLRRRR